MYAQAGSVWTVGGITTQEFARDVDGEFREWTGPDQCYFRPHPLTETLLVSLGAFARLYHLSITGVRGVKSLDALARHVPHLETLWLGHCLEISDASGLGGCPRLKHLGFDNCRRLRSASTLASCTSVEKLTLFACGESSCGPSFTYYSDGRPPTSDPGIKPSEAGVANLDALARCTHLRTLQLSFLANRSFDELGALHQVEHIEFEGCCWLKSLDMLRMCGNLCTLNVDMDMASRPAICASVQALRLSAGPRLRIDTCGYA